MFARIRSVSLSARGRACLIGVCLGLPSFASCTASEDTEPFVPAAPGATQPAAQGDLVSEEGACQRLLQAANAAYERLGCTPPTFPKCPSFLRPGGGTGCYEYFEDSVSACEEAYEAAPTCRELSPCLATAERNDAVATCETEDLATGGVAGVAGAGVAGAGGAGPGTDGGAPGASGSPAAGQGGAG